MLHSIKSGILFLAILIPAFAYGYEPQGTARSVGNIYGGQNYYSQSGRYLGKSSKNVFGGYNYYNNRGSRYNQTYKSGNVYRRVGK